MLWCDVINNWKSSRAELLLASWLVGQNLPSHTNNQWIKLSLMAIVLCSIKVQHALLSHPCADFLALPTWAKIILSRKLRIPAPARWHTRRHLSSIVEYRRLHSKKCPSPYISAHIRLPNTADMHYVVNPISKMAWFGLRLKPLGYIWDLRPSNSWSPSTVSGWITIIF